MKNFLNFLTLSALIMMTGCDQNAQPKTEMTQNAQPASIKYGEYGQWDKNVKQSNSVIGASKTQLQPVYNKIFAYEPVSFGQTWILDMANIAMQNQTFKQSVLSSASGDKAGFAKKIIATPYMVSGLFGADAAFKSVLNNIANNDADYRLRAAQFEASARKQSLPKYVPKKSINYFSLSNYTNQSASNPSIMERTLAIAALNILSDSGKTPYQNDIARLAQNNAVSNCLYTAKRNSAQCNAASYDSADLSFCMSKHNIAEVSKCMSFLLP